MRIIKLWNNGPYSCCRKVSERSTVHMCVCHNTTITLQLKREFHSIINWLEEMDTDPLLLYLINAFWHREEVLMDTDYPPALASSYQIMRDIGLQQM